MSLQLFAQICLLLVVNASLILAAYFLLIDHMMNTSKEMMDEYIRDSLAMDEDDSDDAQTPYPDFKL